MRIIKFQLLLRFFRTLFAYWSGRALLKYLDKILHSNENDSRCKDVLLLESLDEKSITDTDHKMRGRLQFFISTKQSLMK